MSRRCVVPVAAAAGKLLLLAVAVVSFKGPPISPAASAFLPVDSRSSSASRGGWEEAGRGPELLVQMPFLSSSGAHRKIALVGPASLHRDEDSFSDDGMTTSEGVPLVASDPGLALAAVSTSTRNPLSDQSESSRARDSRRPRRSAFSLTTALFCAGLAFDSYVEPPSNSSRWERGSKGLNVAFCSQAFTRSLYKGLVEITPIKCIGLPDQVEGGGGAEEIVTGKGVDAAILVAAIEGSWKDDVQLLEKTEYNQGVLDLTGAAHVGRSATAWANVDEKMSNLAKRQRGRASPYHIPATWGKGGQAVWPEPEPFYLYLQDPATVRLVFSILDDNRMGEGTVVGSTHKRLVELIPQAKLSPDKVIAELKRELLEELKAQNRDRNLLTTLDQLNETSKIQLGAKTWTGTLKMTSKPRKKDKNSQILAGAAAGAYVAGPVGAAVGGLIGSFYEGSVDGYMDLKIRYLPIPQVQLPRRRYTVLGGMPGINWGQLFQKHVEVMGPNLDDESTFLSRALDDLEHCYFINHDSTGATCAVYRSLEKKVIVVSFRGTCRPVDLLTDVSIVQETWVEGDDLTDDIPKVHAGFRGSLNSISRRLKELLLATVAPGDDLSKYDLLVTGHSLGGALATLFTADIGEYGVDAGRGLPQLQESEPWWKSLASTFTGKSVEVEGGSIPPRPKSLRLYSFGSPRVGNHAFAELFDAMLAEGLISEAYRVVNGNDVVARLPRTVNVILGSVGYEHCGPTVLLTQPEDASSDDDSFSSSTLLWVEGESDDRRCPVRDGVALTSPTAEGNLIAELFANGSDGAESDTGSNPLAMISSAVSKLSQRAKTLTAGDVMSIVGIDKAFAGRELKIIQSLFKGEAVKHHLEDEYYAGLGGAAGFRARVDEEIVELESVG